MAQTLPTITLLGPIALRIGDKRQKLPFAGRTRQLFTYLAGHANSGVRRDCLQDEIWPGVDASRAGSGLNTAVWRIKNALAAYHGITLTTIDDIVRLTVEAPARVDVQDLSRAVERAALSASGGKLTKEAHIDLLTGVSTCRGPFLDGCSEHWVLPLRERFTALRVRALTLLMHDCAARRQYEAALGHGQSILALDMLREGTQREVMWLYALNGQRAQAVRQFHMLTQLLEAELGIEPMPETIALFKKIVEARDSVFRMTQAGARDGSLKIAVADAVCPELVGAAPGSV